MQFKRDHEKGENYRMYGSYFDIYLITVFLLR